MDQFVKPQQRKKLPDEPEQWEAHRATQVVGKTCARDSWIEHDKVQNGHTHVGYVQNVLCTNIRSFHVNKICWRKGFKKNRNPSFKAGLNQRSLVAVADFITKQGRKNVTI